MKPYQRGDVVIIDMPILANSHIQSGKRPWVIVQNNVGNQFSPTSIVVPLTTKFKRLEMPTHVAVTWGDLQPSMVECEQVRVVDVTDSWKYLCTLPPEIMCHVDTALKNAFFYGGGCKRWRTMKKFVHCPRVVSKIFPSCLARSNGVRGGTKTLKIVRHWYW